MPVAVKAIAADSVTATTMAAVNNGRIAVLVDDTVTGVTPIPEVVQDADIELLRTALKNSQEDVNNDDAFEGENETAAAMVLVDADAVNKGRQ